MKIAIPTADGQTISAHLGQAHYFQILTLEDQQIINSEMREKARHEHHDHQPENGIHPGQAMFALITDCQVLIAGGMGEPAYQRALNQGMQVFMTDEKNIPAALKAYQSGQLTSDQRRIHKHS